LREARDAAAPFLSQGRSTVAHIHFLHCDSETSVRYQAQALRLLPEGDLRRELSSPPWQAALYRDVPIRRTWGAVGFLWALLLDELQGTAPKWCELCGSAITGKRRVC